jgi:hypothetical protein
MDTRIGHDSSDEAQLLARLREHVQEGLLFSERRKAPARQISPS